jgi:hypothetical protein
LWVYGIVCALSLAQSSGIAHAQTYPSKPVRVLHGFAVGGAIDMEIVPTTPEQFASRVHFDYERYGKLIKSSGIEIER